MNAITSPVRFGMVSYHPAIPTAGTTDPAREERGGGRGDRNRGTRAGKPTEKQIKTNQKSNSQKDLN